MIKLRILLMTIVCSLLFTPMLTQAAETCNLKTESRKNAVKRSTIAPATCSAPDGNGAIYAGSRNGIIIVYQIIGHDECSRLVEVTIYLVNDEDGHVEEIDSFEVETDQCGRGSDDRGNEWDFDNDQVTLTTDGISVTVEADQV